MQVSLDSVFCSAVWRINVCEFALTVVINTKPSAIFGRLLSVKLCYLWSFTLGTVAVRSSLSVSLRSGSAWGHRDRAGWFAVVYSIYSLDLYISETSLGLKGFKKQMILLFQTLMVFGLPGFKYLGDGHDPLAWLTFRAASSAELRKIELTHGRGGHVEWSRALSFWTSVYHTVLHDFAATPSSREPIQIRKIPDSYLSTHRSQTRRGSSASCRSNQSSYNCHLLEENCIISMCLPDLQTMKIKNKKVKEKRG